MKQKEDNKMVKFGMKEPGSSGRIRGGCLDLIDL